MGFNKKTWAKDYSGTPGLKKLAAADALRKGFAPKKTKAKDAKDGK